MRLSEFDYELPERLIAQTPVEPRDSSRLLVLDRPSGTFEHTRFSNIVEHLHEGDLLVANDARVLPARLRGKKRDTGGKVELLLCEQLPAVAGEVGERWLALGQASKGLKPGLQISFGALEGEVLADAGEGEYEVRLIATDPVDKNDVHAAIARSGELPLPPYIKRAPGANDADRYQTIYAQRAVAAAAPTAGLHFTPGLLERLKTKGVQFATLTLHVGPGTFLPVRVDDVSQHVMHQESFEIPDATVEAIAKTKAAGKRVIAVGTTAVRALEASAKTHGQIQSGRDRAGLFITPGFSFRAVDALITNFHLPKSTLLMLVSAFAGRDLILAAYREAVRLEYRFFSYGDAMFIR